MTEGDWLAEDVRVNKKVVVSRSTTGLSAKDVKKLKSLRKKTILVREGIPFVPGFFIAFLLLLILQHIFENWLQYLL